MIRLEQLGSKNIYNQASYHIWLGDIIYVLTYIICYNILLLPTSNCNHDLVPRLLTMELNLICRVINCPQKGDGMQKVFAMSRNILRAVLVSELKVFLIDKVGPKINLAGKK